ncbi:site-specific integrase [Methylocystis sp.]|uniref:site-specific integrase n=1 Tax=Methylocystis sp. TaxID=1911079 RepID=UPI0025F5A9F3|nr:site-specific integrase [Methylocystis sp.]
MSIYATGKASKHARPHETAARLERLLEFFGDKPLSFINGTACDAYVEYRGSQSAARRELEDLRAAITHHREQGYCSEIVGVALPEKSLPRERWLTRSEAARLLWAAWRARQIDANKAGAPTKRPVGQHVARFILVGLYTGTRAGAVCGASLDRLSGRGYIDLEGGVFYRRAEGVRETKKRQTPAPLPDRLLAHLRRWHRLGLCKTAVVEWGGKPVERVNKGFRKAAATAGLENVMPHTLRHTAATWLMKNRCDLWEAAGFLGMTVETLERVYGHHHPDYQRGAANKIAQKPGGHRLGTVSAEQKRNKMQ